MDNTRGLFRGKRTDNGEWVQGSYFPAPNIAIRGKLNHFIVTTNSLGTIMYLEIDPSTRGEYTGLTDKNGKMIFEGDIIRTKKYGKIVGRTNVNDFDIFRVVYIPGQFRLERDNPPRGFNLIDNGLPEFEIIGNIYDNPELMGGQDG